MVLSFFYLSLLPLFSALLVLMPANAKSQRSEIVPFEQWNCGASNFDKSLSHQLSKEDCPKRMYEADLCCVVHDICYMDEKRSQQECDAAFCHCLDRTVAQSARATNNKNTTASGCQTVSDSFCEIVKLFGGMAYATARQLVDKQREAMDAWEAAKLVEGKMAKEEATDGKTTTPVVPSSSSTTSPSPGVSSSSSSSTSAGSTKLTSSPAEIGHFVTQKFPLNCLDDSLSKCTKQLQQCTSLHFNAASDGVEGDALVLGAQLAECSAQFCQCASKEQFAKVDRNGGRQREQQYKWTLGQMAKGPRDECAQSLATICSQFADMPTQGNANVNFWSVNVNYIGHPISLGLAMVASLLLLLLLAIFGFFLVKLVSFVKRRLQMEESIRKNYAKSSIRRNTLTALRSVSGGANNDDEDVERGGGGGPHYIPFGGGHQKESTVSTPEPAAQKLLANGHLSHGGAHHHKKAHSDVNKNLLHSPQHNMPLNSSQVHLIASTGNSSSTLSDISSS